MLWAMLLFCFCLIIQAVTPCFCCFIIGLWFPQFLLLVFSGFAFLVTSMSVAPPSFGDEVGGKAWSRSFAELFTPTVQTSTSTLKQAAVQKGELAIFLKILKLSLLPLLPICVSLANSLMENPPWIFFVRNFTQLVSRARSMQGGQIRDMS